MNKELEELKLKKKAMDEEERKLTSHRWELYGLKDLIPEPISKGFWGTLFEDRTHCPKCESKLDYTPWLTYMGITTGHFKCPKCDYEYVG